MKEFYHTFEEEIYHYGGSLDNSLIYHVMSGISFPNPSYEIQRKVSKAYSIEYIYEGEGVIQQNDKIFHVCQGDFFILSPNKFHHYFSSPKNPWKKIWIVLEGDYSILEVLFELYKIDDTILLKGINNPLQLEEIFQLLKNKPTNIGRQLEMFLFLLVRDIAEIAKNHKTEDNPAILGKLYIDKMIYNKISIKQICDSLSIEHSYFFRLFKKEFGISPSKYILSAKINIAKKYLEETNSSITQIAEKLAFNDAAHFSRTFKMLTGMNPSEFKNKIKNGTL